MIYLIVDQIADITKFCLNYLNQPIEIQYQFGGQSLAKDAIALGIKSIISEA